jgi:hypothetical protein
MSLTVRIALAFVLGLVASYAVAVAVGLLYRDWAGIFDREGAYSMGIVFVIGPFFGLIGGAAAAVAAYLYFRGRSAAALEATPKANESAARRRDILISAAIVGGAVFLLTRFFVWFQMGTAYDNYQTAVLILWSPYLLGGAAAALAVLLAARR